MKIYDISMEIHPEMPLYKDQEQYRPTITVHHDFNSGKYHQSSIEINMHSGTHIDAPLHMLAEGGAVDNLDLNKLVAKCKVYSLTHLPDRITEKDLRDRDITNGDFVILKTRNSLIDKFDPEFVYLDKSAAAYLKSKEVIGVGIDALSIERNQPDHDTHTLLLGAGIIILEGLRLKRIEDGEYLMVAVPLNIKGVEASPVRAVLVRF